MSSLISGIGACRFTEVNILNWNGRLSKRGRAMLKLLMNNRREREMSSIFDVAACILEATGYMSTMKLQKLAYYSQAYSLVYARHPLFGEDFQAWVNGPVCPNLFHIHRHQYVIGPENLEGHGSACALTTPERRLVLHVCDVLSGFDGNELSALTHNELPWSQARAGCLPEERCANVISKESMLAYYSAPNNTNPLFSCR